MSIRQAPPDWRQTMYLLYSDLCGSLADYSLHSEAQRVGAGLPCEDVHAAGSAAAVAAPSRLSSLLRQVSAVRFRNRRFNGGTPSPADTFGGERS
ncbi:hypothetical protein P3T23_003134 [Paraburkholderia sp. GAS448]|jgi:hypothetical protein